MKKMPPVLLHGGDYNPDQWLDHPDILAKDVECVHGYLCLVRPGARGRSLYF